MSVSLYCTKGCRLTGPAIDEPDSYVPLETDEVFLPIVEVTMPEEDARMALCRPLDAL